MCVDVGGGGGGGGAGGRGSCSAEAFSCEMAADKQRAERIRKRRISDNM